MEYDVNKLPDFYSVRNYEQLNYSLENMEGKKCYCFFDNGFTSNIIEPNKRNTKFVWDGFILFVDPEITLESMKAGVNLYNGRLVSLQRSNSLGKKFNNSEVRDYITSKLREKNIPFEIMEDTKEVEGNPSCGDLWSTRDFSVLIEAVECTGNGDAFYYPNEEFQFEITFGKSKIPPLSYGHLGAIVLRGENSVAISRLILSNNMLQEFLEQIIGCDKVYSYLEGKNIKGTSISNMKVKILERTK